MSSLQELAWKRYVHTLPISLRYVQTPCLHETICWNSPTHAQLRPFPTDILQEVEVLDNVREKHDYTTKRCFARGRTGKQRSELVITHKYDRKRKRICFRFDDLANSEFWLAAEIPIDEIIDEITTSI